jgi:dihydrodipicolinate synthase/N-acetylneuraminate lyase
MVDILSRHGYLGSLKAVLAQQGIPVGPVRLPLRSPSVDDLRVLLSAWEAWVAE